VTLPDPAELWEAAFEGEVAARVEASGVSPDQWKAAGRASKAYPDKEDGRWWADHGPDMVKSYVEWRDSVSWQLWETPAHLPAIEVELKCSFGDVPVRMFIDRIMVTPEGELVIVDMKSGSSKPQDQGLQLGFYASGVEVVFGIRPAYGVFYNARTGGISAPYNVDHLTPEFLGQLLGEFVRARRAGLFIPNLSQNCGNCGVKRACAAVNGPEAATYDPLYLEAK
jgi:hypothetical protein